VFLNGLSGHSVLGFGLCLTGKYGDLLDFVVIIVLIFYILTIRDIYSSKKMPDAERTIELWLSVLPAFYIVVATAICIAAVYKTSTSGWGVVIMLLGFRFII
jgi:APA family basic amino acid/polyamine antiporter